MDKIITPNGIFENDYSDNNNLYSIKIDSNSNEIQISIIELNNTEELSTCYKGSFSKDKIAGNNPILSKINLEDIIDILINVINSKKLTIVKDNQYLITSWNFIMIKEVEFKLILTKEKIDDKEIIQQLLTEIKNLKKENYNLKKEFQNIKKDVEILKTQVDSILFQGSNIVTSLTEKSKIKEWIYEINENNICKEIKKIYCATRDGDSALNYHQLCDNKSPLITLIKTKKNRKFGHYTEEKLVSKNKSNYSKDEKAFLFSLDKMKKYDIKKPKKAIWYGEVNGPCIGEGCDIYLNGGFLTNENNVERSGSCKTYDVPNDNELAGEYFFGVDELEVYQIII